MMNSKILIWTWKVVQIFIQGANENVINDKYYFTSYKLTNDYFFNKLLFCWEYVLKKCYLKFLKDKSSQFCC